MNRPKIVCLCGSTRFIEHFEKANLQMTLQGLIVLSVGCNTKSDNDLFSKMTDEERALTKARLDVLHYSKIEMCDLVYVVNCQNYIGESTRREIEYAKACNKPVKFLFHSCNGEIGLANNYYADLFGVL